jgi:hypothetical protein
MCGTAAAYDESNGATPEPGDMRAFWLELGLRSEVDPLRVGGSDRVALFV